MEIKKAEADERDLLRRAVELAVRLASENETLRAILYRHEVAAALTRPRPRGRPIKARARLHAGQPGRTPKYTGDDLAAFAEFVPVVRNKREYREWLSAYDLRDSKKNALAFLLKISGENAGTRRQHSTTRSALAEVATLRRRLNEWEKTRAR